MEIRDFYCVRFSKRVAKTKRKREIDLLCKLKQLNECLDQNHQDTNWTPQNGTRKKISENKTKGAIIRSTARWYERIERNSTYFVNLKKRAYERKHIVKMKQKKMDIWRRRMRSCAKWKTFTRPCILLKYQKILLMLQHRIF